MEIVDNSVSLNSAPETLTVNPEIKNYLSESAKWARFMGIVGYVFVGLMIIAAFFMGTFMSFLGKNAARQSGVNPFASGAVSIVMGAYLFLIALLYYFPSRYLHQFGVKTRLALRNNDQINFTESLARLKSFFKFFGVLTIVVLALYGLMLIGMIFFATFMSNRS